MECPDTYRLSKADVSLISKNWDSYVAGSFKLSEFAYVSPALLHTSMETESMT